MILVSAHNSEIYITIFWFFINFGTHFVIIEENLCYCLHFKYILRSVVKLFDVVCSILFCIAGLPKVCYYIQLK